MKNNLKFIAVAAVSMAIGLSINNYAISNVPANYKVAVVDVSKVVGNSKQVASLKEEQKKKVADLTKFVQTAKTNIAKETDATKKKALEEKYSKELASKKAAMEKDYATKLKAIDKSISDTISARAKLGGYNLVLSKSVVLSGGEDITSAIMAAVK
ncbi:OmpH family outer membrane protein [bacterium]|nr:OmpH family outer membrane protein [bacterium]